MKFYKFSQDVWQTSDLKSYRNRENVSCGIGINDSPIVKFYSHSDGAVASQALAKAFRELVVDSEESRRFGIPAYDKVETEYSWYYVASIIKEVFQSIR